MSFLAVLDRALSRVCAVIGRAVAWLVLALVGLTFAVVLLRYGFSFGRIYLQELTSWLHAMVFMLAAAWTLRLDGHVRVDVFYRGFSERRKAWVDLFGTVFLLLPTAGLLLWLSSHYAATAWLVQEASRETGGLPGLYVLKTVIPVAWGLLALQGIADVCRRLNDLLGASR